MVIKEHCKAGQPVVKESGDFGSMGKDYTITCPCGYKKRYAWMHREVAIGYWNEQMKKVA